MDTEVDLLPSSFELSLRKASRTTGFQIPVLLSGWFCRDAAQILVELQVGRRLAEIGEIVLLLILVGGAWDGGTRSSHDCC